MLFYDGADFTGRSEGSRPCRHHWTGRASRTLLISPARTKCPDSYGQHHRGRNRRTRTVAMRPGQRIMQRRRTSPRRGRGRTSGSASNGCHQAIRVPRTLPT